MTRDQPAHVEPSKHSTDELAHLLRRADGVVDVSRGAFSGRQSIRHDVQDLRHAGQAVAPQGVIAPETLEAATRVAHNFARRSMPSVGAAGHQSDISGEIPNNEPRGEVAAILGTTAIAMDGSSGEFQPLADLPFKTRCVPPR